MTKTKISKGTDDDILFHFMVELRNWAKQNCNADKSGMRSMTKAEAIISQRMG